jgi:hypothetical protein
MKASEKEVFPGERNKRKEHAPVPKFDEATTA